MTFSGGFDRAFHLWNVPESFVKAPSRRTNSNLFRARVIIVVSLADTCLQEIALYRRRCRDALRRSYSGRYSWKYAQATKTVLTERALIF